MLDPHLQPLGGRPRHGLDLAVAPVGRMTHPGHVQGAVELVAVQDQVILVAHGQFVIFVQLGAQQASQSIQFAKTVIAGVFAVVIAADQHQLAVAVGGDGLQPMDDAPVIGPKTLEIQAIDGVAVEDQPVEIGPQEPVEQLGPAIAGPQVQVGKDESGEHRLPPPSQGTHPCLRR